MLGALDKPLAYCMPTFIYNSYISSTFLSSKYFRWNNPIYNKYFLQPYPMHLVSTFFN